MKQFLAISIVSILSVAAYGQNTFQEQFDTFKNEVRQQYVVYNDSIKSAFIKSIEENWIKFQTHHPIPVPQKPIPQMDIQTTPEEYDSSLELEIDSIIRQKASLEEACLWNVTIPNKEKGHKTMVSFYGSELQFLHFIEYKYSLADLDEKTIASVWEQLSDSPYTELINTLLFYKNDMNLNDWGTFQLLGRIVETFYPGKKNEQTVFSTFIMNQMGFRMKIGRCNNRLIHLIPFQTTVYGKPFINFEGEKYYILEDTDVDGGIYSYTIDYPNATKQINLHAQRPFRLSLSLHTKQCNIGDKKYNININKNLINLFQTYPQTEISVYANTPLSNITRKSLEKELLPQLSGKAEQEAVNYLLQFVQTSFEYKNDLQQFGFEKFFFAEELFYYPFSDCEDRSVLFSQLVRRFLGLQVVLLDYPDHVTTAVKFNTPVPGDFIYMEGEKYIICDPTYLHAKVGQSIPRYKKQKAQIYILD
ncbi:MAG: hypothetical protein J6K31_01930 [Parabacteroides sp.]|nr:hypothetical protein [Parabacteroides sp.]